MSYFPGNGSGWGAPGPRYPHRPTGGRPSVDPSTGGSTSFLSRVVDFFAMVVLTALVMVAAYGGLLLVAIATSN